MDEDILNTINDDDDDYNEASDEDFDPSVATAQPAQDSSDEDEKAPAGSKPANCRHNAPIQDNEAGVLDFDNSGDESTIQGGKKRKRKAAAAEDLDDEGGLGGFVKTRAQRKADGNEKRPLANVDQASVDVDALWARLSSKAVSNLPVADSAHGETIAGGCPPGRAVVGPSDASNDHAAVNASASSECQDTGSEDMMTIKRRYDFAGQTIEEERIVSASSAEAKLYLEEQNQAGDISKPAKPGFLRPKKRKTPFAGFTADESALAKGKKLNTLQKSKLDWAAHVDKEGIGEELDEASKAKGSYLGKVDFLGRMDAKRDEELRNKK